MQNRAVAVGLSESRSKITRAASLQRRIKKQADAAHAYDPSPFLHLDLELTKRGSRELSTSKFASEKSSDYGTFRMILEPAIGLEPMTC